MSKTSAVSVACCCSSFTLQRYNKFVELQNIRVDFVEVLM
nr:MAG TPA: hypothetical protein [Caudoviricetes sp.]